MKKNKIKVCFISRSAYPLFNPKCDATFGGAEVDFYLLAKELAKDKTFDVNFILGDFGQKKIEIKDGVSLFKSYRLKENKLTKIFKVAKAIYKVNANIYFQEAASGGTGIIAFLCKILGKKFIYRTASDKDCNNQFIKENKIEGYLYKWGLKNANFVITQNKKNQLELLRNLYLKSKVIKNAYPIYPNNHKKKEFILWVGRSEKLKQPQLFLELAKAFPNEQFTMICPKANFNSVDMKKLNEEIKKINNLELISYVLFKEIDKYFRKAKIFINTSTYEGFPNTFVQATKNATPIVTLNVNPDDFINKYKCGFFANGNFELMKKQLSSLLNDTRSLKKISLNAYKYAKKNHDITKIIKEYKKIIGYKHEGAFLSPSIFVVIEK